MQCPNDQTPLAMMERQGIEIDYCPTCRGVWLDRGELDKLIAGGQPSHQPQEHHREADHGYRPPMPSHGDQYHHKKRKKESFLGELFDF